MTVTDRQISETRGFLEKEDIKDRLAMQSLLEKIPLGEDYSYKKRLVK